MTAGTIGQPSGEAPAHRTWSASSLALLLPFVAIVGVAAANGGFNATSFGWTALAFAWLVIIVVIITTPTWAAFDVVWLAVASAVSVYTFASAAWAGSAAAAFDNGLRSLVYLSGIAGALLVLRRGRTSLWLGGLALGASAVCVLLAGDAPVPQSLRCGHRRIRLSPVRADGLLERARHLRGYRIAARPRSRDPRPRSRPPDSHGSGARSVDVDALLHVQPRCMAGARGRAARDVRAQPDAASAARRLDRTRADPGCRRAAGVRGFRR